MAQAPFGFFYPYCLFAIAHSNRGGIPSTELIRAYLYCTTVARYFRPYRGRGDPDAKKQGILLNSKPRIRQNRPKPAVQPSCTTKQATCRYYVDMLMSTSSAKDFYAQSPSPKDKISVDLRQSALGCTTYSISRTTVNSRRAKLPVLRKATPPLAAS